jgi:hypothetical protein
MEWSRKERKNQIEISRKRESKGHRDGMIKKREEMCASEKYQW